MNQRFTYGFASLFGLVSPLLAIEAPDSLTPTRPARVLEQEASTAKPEEAPDPERVAPPEDISRPYLGIGAGELPALLAEHLKLEAGQGVVVHTLDPEGPAAKAGLTENDIVTKVDGRPVGSHEALRDVVGNHKPGEEVAIDFIHRGEVKTAKVALGKAPEMGPEIAGRGTRPIDRLRMNGMPEDQARMLREAIERSQQSLNQLDQDDQLDLQDLAGQGMLKRMQQLMGNAGADIGAQRPGGNGFSFNTGGTLRMMDEQGSVEINSNNGEKQVRVLGRDGKLQWEGPYNSEEDKKKVPADVRERIDHLNIDMSFKGNGIRLQMGPRGER